MNPLQKIERWAEKEITRYVNDIIVPNDNGTVTVFGKYVLHDSKHGCGVYEKHDLVKTFSNKRVAISWCVAMKHRHYHLATNIVDLDGKKILLTNDFNTRKQLALKSRCVAYKFRVLEKLQAKQAYRQSTDKQLEKCIAMTKYLQLKGLVK